MKEKETAVFTCQLNKENAAVKWFRGGLEILPDEKKFKYITIGSTYTLEIYDCQLDDINDYAIFYRGRKCQGRLEVEGKRKRKTITQDKEAISMMMASSIVSFCWHVLLFSFYRTQLLIPSQTVKIAIVFYKHPIRDDKI